MKEEKWLPIPNYEDLYQVSNYGIIKSLPREWSTGVGIRKHNGIILKQCIKKTGYVQVCLSKCGVIKYFLVHRLVALAFIPNTENKKEINHKDGNKLNNNDWNLEWSTPSENIKHSYANKLNIAKKGENHCNSILTDEQILEVRAKYIPWKYTQGMLAKEYKISKGSIQAILENKTRIL